MNDIDEYSMISMKWWLNSRNNDIDSKEWWKISMNIYRIQSMMTNVDETMKQFQWITIIIEGIMMLITMK